SRARAARHGRDGCSSGTPAAHPAHRRFRAQRARPPLRPRASRLSSLLLRVLVDEVDDGLHRLHGGFGKDAVTEVEDVTRSTTRLVEDALRVLQGDLARREERRRIEVALDAAIVADALPAFLERRA